jgi:anti-sigma factor RsiW
MNCILNQHEQEELLLGYCAATLDPETARTFSRHLGTCEQCRELVEMQKIVDETLTDWVPPVMSANFDQKLFARIRAEEAKPQPWWQFQFGWKAWTPVALAALILIVFLVRSPEQSELARQNDMIKADEIEQVERALDDLEALQALHTAETSSTNRESL